MKHYCRHCNMPLDEGMDYCFFCGKETSEAVNRATKKSNINHTLLGTAALICAVAAAVFGFINGMSLWAMGFSILSFVIIFAAKKLFGRLSRMTMISLILSALGICMGLLKAVV